MRISDWSSDVCSSDLVELLLVVDGEREEVLPLARGLVGDGADQQHGALARDHDRATSLASDLAGFDGDRAVAVLEALGNFCHVCIPWMTLAMNRMEALAASRADRAGRSKKEPRRIAAPRCRPGLPAQAELLDEGLVARGILAVQVIEQAAAAVDHLQQTTTAVVVVLVGLEVLGQDRKSVV